MSSDDVMQRAATTGTTPAARARPPGVGLVLIKGVHTIIFLAELASIGWLLLTGIRGRRDRSTGIAASLVAAESAVFVANRGVCPLTPLAERRGAASGSVSDIFLPDVIARTIPLWSTTLIAIAVGLHARGMRGSRAESHITRLSQRPGSAPADGGSHVPV